MENGYKDFLINLTCGDVNIVQSNYMEDNSINVGSVGNLSGQIVSGDSNTVNQNITNSNNSANVQLVEDLLDALARVRTDLNSSYRPEAQKYRVQEIIKQDPLLKQRLLSAIKAGGTELAKAVANNPAISVSLETIRGWIEVS